MFGDGSPMGRLVPNEPLRTLSRSWGRLWMLELRQQTRDHHDRERGKQLDPRRTTGFGRSGTDRSPVDVATGRRDGYERHFQRQHATVRRGGDVRERPDVEV